MSKMICVVTSTRADFGLLCPIIKHLMNDGFFKTKLVVTGTHLDIKHSTEQEIINVGITNYDRIKIFTDCNTSKDMAVATGNAMVEYANYLSNNNFDLVLLLGDRYEIFSFASAAAIMGIPIAHLYGGDTTEGAVDEFFRHSITKMSHLHMCSNEISMRRVIQMGEQPQFVFDVGSTAVEIIKGLKTVDITDLENELNFCFSDSKYVVVTFHPVTTEIELVRQQLSELIQAMIEVDDLKYIITKSNADAGGCLINEIWEEEVSKHDNWILVSSLGINRFISVLKGSSMLLGNSSSGLSEAPILGVPTVNIGNRQKGRIKPQSVIDCENNKDCIIAAMKKALNSSFVMECKSIPLPYGDGTTSLKVVDIIKTYLKSGITNTKTFYDIYNERC